MCCSLCDSSWHAGCGQISPIQLSDPRDNWVCPLCTTDDQPVTSSTCLGSSTLLDSDWTVWLLYFRHARQATLTRIRSLQAKVRSFVKLESTETRLSIFRQNNMSRWFRRVNPKNREPPHPENFGPDGAILTNTPDRLDRIATVHEDFTQSKAFALHSPSYMLLHDSTGRPRYQWIEDPGMFEVSLADRLCALRLRGANDTKLQEYEDTYRHERATWYPGFCALDWQPTDPTQQHPQFPCQPVTQEE